MALDICLVLGWAASGVALLAHSGSLTGRLLYGISHEPLVGRDCVFGAGCGLRIALNFAPTHHEKSAWAKAASAFYLETLSVWLSELSSF